ncbi:THUMP domain-containing protein 1 homolog [Pistacia vera]|uniref:THUMP domain-containing protein 1 homolog n=1 Tax=Pistacia vera TaxID=55513 RepID=UPI00126398C5|nr:THUMP domain-containing protein 1 homolog [Pistacia vera]
MAAENKPKNGGNSTNFNGKKRKHFLPHNKPVKKKGAYPLRPGVQGFFITCDGGRERQAAHEALFVIDSFFDELVNEKVSGKNLAGIPNKPLNKKIVFASSSSDEEDDDDEEEGEGEGKQSDSCGDDDTRQENLTNEKSDPHDSNNVCSGNEIEGMTGENKEEDKNPESQANESEEPPAKKQCLEPEASKPAPNEKVEEKSIDKLIEAELKELGDKSKRRFVNLDSGCNGVAIIQMRKRDGDPGPKDIVQHMMTSAKSTRKPVSRFILRVLPVEVSCYASEEEIQRAIKPLVEQYFPVETQNPQKFAVLYEARANTGIDRMKIINSVAKSVPAPHKVDLSNPDKTIIVEIVKTVCMIGVVEKYKELLKCNLRQLTSPKQ